MCSAETQTRIWSVPDPDPNKLHRQVKHRHSSLPHRQDGDHMRRLGVLTANHRYVWRLWLRRKYFFFATGHFCCFRLSHEQAGPRQIVYEMSRLLEQNRKWSASGLCIIGKRNQPERSGWVGFRPGVIGCLQLKVKSRNSKRSNLSHFKTNLPNRQRNLKPLYIR